MHIVQPRIVRTRLILVVPAVIILALLLSVKYGSVSSTRSQITASDGYHSGVHEHKASVGAPSPQIVYAGGRPTATIDAGVIIGTATSIPSAAASINKFLGIPFAQSPPERFSPPVKPAKWSQPLSVSKWSPACVQEFAYPPEVQFFTKLIFNDPGGPTPEESEDCLYLNVFAPSTPAPADGRTVMFWIYGGGFNFGNAGQPAYDGSFFAAHEDIIVVTTNYRTNVFGFAPSPELPITERNLGFLDQRLALDWVQRNIAAFGGSPDKVTVFGESAGAFSVDILLSTFPPPVKPPFRGAIMQSGQYSFQYSPFTVSSDNWRNLTTHFKCPGVYKDSLTCLRALSAKEIKEYIEVNSLLFNPTYDNVTLLADAAQRRIDGQVAHVPTMSGNNAQEGRVFELGQTNVTAGLIATFGDSPDLIAAVDATYGADTPGIGSSDYERLATIVTDLVFQCPQAIWANATLNAESSLPPTWRYYFNASFTNLQPVPGLGVYHSAEIPLVFGTYPRENATTQEHALSAAMMGAWARFAKNPMGGPGWPAVGQGRSGEVLVGAMPAQEGGVYSDTEGTTVEGTFDLAVLGNRGNAMAAGVTVIDQREVDFRCEVFRELYERVNGVRIPV